MKKLMKKRRDTLRQWSGCKDMIRGSINAVCPCCNRAGCICKNKRMQKAYRLTFKDSHQKTQIVYIPRNRLREIKRMMANYAKSRKIMHRLIALNIEIFKQKLRI